MKLVLVIAMLVLSGCAMGYKKLNSGGTVGGYDEVKISTDTYRVSYQGQPNDPSIKVYKWFLLRSAELTKDSGFSHFLVSDGHETADVRGNMYATATLLTYTGAVKMLKTPDPGAFVADEIIASTPKK